jgi:hypothetical protein
MDLKAQVNFRRAVRQLPAAELFQRQIRERRAVTMTQIDLAGEDRETRPLHFMRVCVDNGQVFKDAGGKLWEQ